MTKFTTPKDWQQKLIAKFDELGVDVGNCNVCSNETKFVADEIVTPINFVKNGQTVDFGTLYPQAMLICSRCGSTTYHNLVILDILDKTPISEDTDG